MEENVPSTPFTFLDLAKAYIESLFNATKSHVGAHYMLLTAESTYRCLKASLGEPPHIFETEVKLLGEGFPSETPFTNDTANFSFSTSLAFDIINKYRIRNGIESFSEGMRPWVVDPVQFFFLSRNIQTFTLKKTASCGIDNIIEPYRWDQKLNIILLVAPHQAPPEISSFQTASNDITPPDTFNSITLAGKMGGEINVYSSFKHISASIPSIVPKLSQTSLLVNFSLISEDTNPKKTLVRMYPTALCPAGYPIPEKYFIDSNTEHLTIRSAFPSLVVLNRRDFLEHGSDLYSQALSLKVPMDAYVIDFIGLKPPDAKSILTSLGLFPSIKYLVCVLNSDRADKSYAPFAILSANGQAASAILTILPYNFPKLIPSLQLIRNTVMAGRPLTSQLAQEIAVYFKSLPLYCQPSVQQLFPAFGLHQYMPAVAPFNKFLIRRIQKMKKSAMEEIMNLESSFRDRGRRRGHEIVDVQALALGAVVPFPKSELDVRPADLLATWERMRRALYGGSGLMVQGLSVRGVECTSGYLPSSYQREEDTVEEEEECWIFGTIGATRVHSTTAHAMSRFEERLAIKEVLRDPFDTSPPDDENEPSGILRRKLSVSFGNKFRGGAQESSGSKSDDSIVELFTDTPAIYRDEDEDEVSVVSHVSSSPSSEEGGGPVIPRLTGGTKRKAVEAVELREVLKRSSDVKEVEERAITKVSKVAEGASPTSTAVESSPVITPAVSPEDQTPPEGWIKAHSSKQNKTYWYNVNTKQSVWVFPTTP